MDKDGTITIDANDFLKGISNSRYTGIEHMRNLDPFSKRGSLRIMPKMVKETDGDIPTTALLKFYDIASTGDIYFATDDTDTSVYKKSGSSWSAVGGATSGVCRGLVITGDYLFRVRNSGGNTVVDRLTLSSATWSNSWGTIRSSGTSSYVPAICGQDGILYFGIDNQLSSISDPTNAATINTNALDLPTGYEIQCLTELGVNLFIGATIGDSAAAIGDIFPWDRTSSTFGLQIQTGLQGIKMMYTKNNLVYAIGGRFGQLFVTNGTTVQQNVKISELTDDPEVQFRDAEQEQIDAFNSGIVFGLGKSGSTDNGACGIWLLRDGALVFQTLSFGQVDTDGYDIGCIVALNDFELLVSWVDLTGANTYGVDISSTSSRYTSYTAFFDSKVYQVGTKLKPKTFQSVCIKLAKVLAVNEGIKVSYRTDSASSYTEIDTFAYGDGTGSDNDNLGAIISVEHAPLNIPACESVQFRVSLTGTTTTPELEYVRVY